jgi:outer membrane protein assembly factor BamB
MKKAFHRQKQPRRKQNPPIPNKEIRSMLASQTRNLAAILFLALLTLAGAGVAAPGKADDPAQGLTLVVGPSAEDGAWLLDLARSGSRHVHVLVRDAQVAEGLRRLVLKSDLDGRITVERWTSKSLPLRSNLVTTVLLADPAVLDAAEAARVVYPGGSVQVRHGADWSKTVKPQPPGLTDWPLLRGDAGDRGVSEDTAIVPPFSPRWIAAEPASMIALNDTRGMVVGDGRLFAVTQLNKPGSNQSSLRVEARNAWNGLPLWSTDIASASVVGLNRLNGHPLALVGDRLLVGSNTGLAMLAVDDGRKLGEIVTNGRPYRLKVADGIAVCASSVTTKGSGKGGFAIWLPDGEGTISAFRIADGKLLWSRPGSAAVMLIHGGILMMQENEGTGETKEWKPTWTIVALDLATGVERWRYENAPRTLLSAGAGVAMVTRFQAATAILDVASGKPLWELPEGKGTDGRGVIRNGEVWADGQRREARSGTVKSQYPRTPQPLGLGTNCAPGLVVGDICTNDRLAVYFELAGSAERAVKRTLGPLRGHCMQGIVPALGALFAGPNQCRCIPDQLRGTVSLGSDGPPPAPAVWSQPRPVEPGPAGPSSGVPAEGWSTFRGDGARSAASAGGPASLGSLRWRTPLVAADGSALALDAARGLEPMLSAPVLSADLALAAAGERGRIIAVDRRSGTIRWTASLPGRVDGPPTLLADSAVVGCHDGWVYCLALADGTLRWRTRAAPAERSLVVRGQVESAWPVIGPLLFHDGLLYAVYGRTVNSDGGIGLLAINPKDGSTQAACGLGEAEVSADVPAWYGDGIAINDVRVALDGNMAVTRIAKKTKERSALGFSDNSWIARRGAVRRLGPQQSGVAAWTTGLSATAVAEGAITITDEAGSRKLPAIKSLSGIHALAFAGKRLVVSGSTSAGGGRVIMLDPASGTELGGIDLPAAGIPDGVAVDASGVCVTSADGSMAWLQP